MHIRNGIRTVLRSKLRSALFALLILVLTLALTLSAGMWGYCAQLLAQFDETYTSIVLAEYMGEDYPDAETADDDARAALEALDDAMITGVTVCMPAFMFLSAISNLFGVGGASVISRSLG